mmetsp:Transcript_3950/g.5494  ORF Transcript_3950/g.5494 Transcript_3950/m.5494 type:complete len:323 (+) Transcript_3950:133-1101(+)
MFILDPELIPIFSGAGAGLTTTLLCSPVDVAKARVQLSGKHVYSGGLLSTLKIIQQNEGFRGWYKGLAPAMFTVPLFWAIYFPCYEELKRRLVALGVGDHGSAIVHMLGAVGSGFVSDIVTNPFWVVRTRLQTQFLHKKSERYRSMTQAFIQIARDEGLIGFYKGLSASLLGLSHVAIQFPIYEWLKHKARQRNGGEQYSETTADLIAASAVSKLFGSAVTYPHEVLRTRLQDNRGRAYRLVDVVKRMVKEEGIKSLYQGFKLNLIRVVPSCISTFVSYELLMNKINELQPPTSKVKTDSWDKKRQETRASGVESMTPEDMA